MKILHVEDSPLERKSVIRLLKANGITNEILEAENGEEALEIVAKNYSNIGLIILDWQMPVMNGIEFLKALAKVPAVSEIPVIMLTASGSDENIELAYKISPGLGGYITKPFAPEKLVDEVRTLIK